MNAAGLGAAALVLAATLHAAHAQDRVYRCGASYSGEPCAGGSAIAVDDARSAGQVAQARRVAQLDARLADALAREREHAERDAARQGPIVIGARRQPGRDAVVAHRPHGRAKAEKDTLYRAAGPR